jgi:acyl carrier protein
MTRGTCCGGIRTSRRARGPWDVGFSNITVDFSDSVLYLSRVAQVQSGVGRADVERAVIERIAEVKQRDAAEFEQELRASGPAMLVDSLDAEEALAALEDDFGISLPTDKETANALRSVKDLAEHILKKLSERRT